MAKVYDHKIDRYTEWGGDTSTGGLPVAGNRVQEFLKEELNGKFGSVYLNTGTSEYLCFANSDTETEYKRTHDETLILGRFQAVSNYSVYLVDTMTEKSVLSTHTNNKLSFKFKVVSNGTQTPTGEPVKIEYSFNNAGTEYSFTEERYPEGEDVSGYTPVSFIMDDYISEGTNNITIKVTGENTFATGQIGMVYEMFNLTYSPTFDYSKTWQRTEENIEIQYTIQGAKTKYIEWYIDGTKCKEDTTITDISGGDTVKIPTVGLSVGVHTFQTRAYVLTTSGAKFYTQNYFYTFAIAGGTNPCVLVKDVVTDGSLMNSGLTLFITVPEFETFDFDWGFYDPQNRELDVTFTFGGKQVSTVTKKNSDNAETFTYRPVNSGTSNLIITIADENEVVVYSYIIVVNVTKSDTALSEAKSGMILKLSAMGRSNDEKDRTEDNPTGTRNVWEYETEGGITYSTTFSGFSWSSQQGWNDNKLVMSDGAFIDINIKPMASDWAKNGGTIEVDLETFDVEDENATVCICSDGTEDAAYVKITATQAKIKPYGVSGNPLETRFRDNDRMHLCFIGNAAGKLEDSNLIYIVNNGVLERAVNFNNGDQIVSQSTLRLGDIDGNGKVKCRIRSIRVYNRALSVDEAFANYVIDSDNVQKIYEDNDIYKQGSMTEVDYDKIVKKIPVLIFTGTKFPMINKGADKTAYFFDVEYTNMQDPTRNFTAFHVQTKLQGTSSLGYPRKNYKIKTKNGKLGQEEFDATNLTFDPVTRRLYNKETGIEIDYENVLTTCWTFNYLGGVQKNGNMKVKSDETKKVNDWTLKADYMESSCSHNTGAAKMWNNIFKNVKLSNTNTYKEKANEWAQGKSTAIRQEVEGEILSQADYLCRTQAQKVAEAYGKGEVRTALDGFPIVCFYRLTHDSSLVFMGQYNFNNDKSSEELFGFEDAYKENEEETESTKIFDASEVECWEGLSNTNPIGLFKNNSLFYQEWSKTYESRYPAQDETGPGGEPLYTLTNLKELNDWVISTRHVSGETVYGSAITIDPKFAEKINDYKYGYDINNITESFIYSAGTGVVPDNAANRQKKFEVEKWEHFDVWKLAGYYIFLIRYGAVDQFVKNTMLTTEGIGKFGGKYKKWYFINYDNDCLFGLRNNGVLAFNYDMDRNTEDPDWDPGQYESGYTPDVVYAMMGHDSTLWNNLEADEEFMRMVRDLDDAMHSVVGGASLTYDGFCQIFDTEQTDCWCERIYNSNERYKYIYPFKGIGDASGQSTNNLWMLQGTRKAHRHWWLANRLEYYDAKWISGDYKNSFLEMKANVSPGTSFDIVAGADFYYAWGNNKTLIESNVKLKAGDEYTFVSPTAQVQGDPIRIYAASKIRELDLTDYMAGITQLAFTGITTETTNEMRTLLIGNENRSNTALSNIDSISNMPNIEYLDITNCMGIKTLDISVLPNIHTFKAKGTSLQSFKPTDGAKITLAELPSTLQSLELKNVAFTNGLTDLKYTVSTTLKSLTIANKKGTSIDYYTQLIRPWLDLLKTSSTKEILYKYAELHVSDINWSTNNINDLYAFEEFSHSLQEQGESSRMTISGKIDFRGYGSLSREEMTRIKGIFGENCFSRSNALYILCPTSIFIESDKTEMVAGKTNIFSSTIYPARPDSSTLTYLLSAGTREGITLITTYSGTSEIGVLNSTENREGHDSEFTIGVMMKTTGDITRYSNMSFKILEPTYPSTATMDGENSIYTNVSGYNYSLSLQTSDGKKPIGSYNIEWVLSGSDEAMSYINTGTSGPSEDKLSYIIRPNNGIEPEISAELSLTATITPKFGSVITKSMRVLVLNHDVIMTDISNPTVMAKCYEQGWSTMSNAMLKSDAEDVTDLGTVFSGITTEFSFNELQYFTGLSGLTEKAFAGSKVTKITIPDNITTIGNYAFSGCSKLYSVNIGNVLTYIPEGCFVGCSSLSKFNLPTTCLEIQKYAFGGTNIKRIVSAITSADTDTLLVSEGLLRIQDDAFEKTAWTDSSTDNKLTYVYFPSTLTNIGDEGTTLRGKNIAEFDVSSGNTTFSSHDGVLYNYATTMLYKYPAMKTGDTYEGIMNSEQFSNYAFYYTKNLKHLTIPNGTSILGKWCFAESGLADIDFSKNSLINSLPEYAMYGCSDLTGITFNTIDRPLKTMGRFSFSSCVSLKEIDIPDGVNSIASMAFADCVSIEDINIPQSVTYIGGSETYEGRLIRGAFTSCGSLSAVTLPNMLTNLQINTFYGCGLLEEVTLPIFSYTVVKYEVRDGNDVLINTYDTLEEATTAAATVEGGHVTSIDTNVIINSNIPTSFANFCSSFKRFIINENDNNNICTVYDGCINIKNQTTGVIQLSCVPNGKETIAIADNVQRIGEYVFSYCNIKNFNIPDNVTTISINAFSDNKTVEECIIGSGVTNLNNSTFFSCTSLKKVVLRAREFSNIASLAFYRCSSLTSLTIYSKTLPSLSDGAASYLPSTGTIYVSYGMKSLYENDTNWKTIFIDKGWTVVENPEIMYDLYLRIKVDGTYMEDNEFRPYLFPENEDGRYFIACEYLSGGSYSGCYRYQMSNVVNNEKLNYRETYDGNNLAYIQPWVDTYRYEIEYNRQLSLVMANSNVNMIPRQEYDILKTKVSQLEAKINNFLEK